MPAQARSNFVRSTSTTMTPIVLLSDSMLREIGEFVAAAVAPGRREDRVLGALGVDEGGAVAEACADAVAVGRGHHAAVAVQQQDRGGADLVLER